VLVGGGLLLEGCGWCMVRGADFLGGVGAMDGATIRGVRYFIETYGAVGMLFDVQVETRFGTLARVGTGRITEIGDEVGGV